jgi:iron complex outermembrane receptor protein
MQQARVPSLCAANREGSKFRNGQGIRVNVSGGDIMKSFIAKLALLGLISGVSTTALAQGQAAVQPEAAATDGVGEIIVTAQKREQSLNSVGLSVTAATASTLTERGVTDVGDLAKIVPGFNATPSGFGATQVYTLRGVGLYDAGLGSTPSVAVYVDEIARPFSVTQLGATLDLERVEVLKGPQGTLFGQSATGGAVNYIAAKPTDTFKFGADVSYERFGKIDASGFVSGPLSNTLKARLAVRAVEGGEWQYSATRPSDRSGNSRILMGRLLLDYEASDRLRLSLNVNGTRDRSDSQRAKFKRQPINIVNAPDPRNPYAIVDPAGYLAITDPASAGFDASFLQRQNVVFNRAAAGDAAAIGYLAGPAGNGRALPNNARIAEWTPGLPKRSNDSYYQFALRSDYDISENIILSSLTSFQKAKNDHYFDVDATIAQAVDDHTFGSTKTFSQELRLSGKTDSLNWIVGANYDHSTIDDNVHTDLFDIALGELLPGLRWDSIDTNISQKVKSYAAFGNVDFNVSENLKILAGIRYTKNIRDAAQCNSDNSVNQNLSKTFGNATFIPGLGFYDLQSLALGLPDAGHVVLQPGQCHSLNDIAAPTDPAYFRPIVTPWKTRLSEDNVSFRVGANYKTDGGSLLYATISQGYKAGLYTNLSAGAVSQYFPAVQEKLVAYEAGVKVPLLDRKVRFNASGFYYDYSNKQIRARTRDPRFGLLEALINVPKSYILGAEAELTARPVEGLDLSLSGTYLKSKVTSHFQDVKGLAVYNQAGYTGDFYGSKLPYTPSFSAVFDGQYEFPVNSRISAFFGGTVRYNGSYNTTFANNILKADVYNINSYAILDLRAGLAAPDGSWKLTAYGQNVTNKYYETGVFSAETDFVFAGRPSTYGLRLSIRMP